MRGLTSDVESHDINNFNNNYSTHFYDVFRANDTTHFDRDISTLYQPSIIADNDNDEENDNSLHE